MWSGSQPARSMVSCVIAGSGLRYERQGGDRHRSRRPCSGFGRLALISAKGWASSGRGIVLAMSRPRIGVRNQQEQGLRPFLPARRRNEYRNPISGNHRPISVSTFLVALAAILIAESPRPVLAASQHGRTLFKWWTRWLDDHCRSKSFVRTPHPMRWRARARV